MFGVQIYDDEPTYIFCDNEAVVKNCSNIASVLNKKHSLLAYNAARWSVAAGETVIGWINTAFNIADAFTKQLTEDHRNNLFWSWTY